MAHSHMYLRWYWVSRIFPKIEVGTASKEKPKHVQVLGAISDLDLNRLAVHVRISEGAGAERRSLLTCAR